jgi:hypothetical protein
MKKIVSLLILLPVFCVSFSQKISKYSLAKDDNNPGFHTKSWMNNNNSVSFNNYIADSIYFIYLNPDSTVGMILKNNWEGNKLTIQYKRIDEISKELKNFEKVEFYVDKTIDVKYLSYLSRQRDVDNMYIPFCVGDTLAHAYEWDTTTNQWKQFSVSKRIYSEDGVNTETVNYHWDTASNNWEVQHTTRLKVVSTDPDTLNYSLYYPGREDTSKYNYSGVYNDKNQLVIIDNYNGFGLYRDSLLYDENGNVKYLYSFDTDRGFYFYYREFFYNNDNNLINSYSYTKETPESTWEFYFKLKYYYSEKTSVIKPVTRINNKLSVFPNPANNYIHLDGYNGNIKIVNLLGQTVKEGYVSNNGSIDISTLKPGYYIIRFDDKIQTEMFIKQ